MSRFCFAALALTVVATGCGGDDPTPSTEPHTTVPVATSAHADVEPSTSTAVPLFGDLDAVAITVEEVVVLDEPIDAAVAANGEWWIAQRDGTILEVDSESGEIGATILDIGADTRATGERGLLGIATDATGLYVNYTDLAGTTHVDGWPLDDAGRPITDQRRSLLVIEQPFSNHNGGALEISPADGHLYIGVGDGGSGGDPLGSGQDTNTLLGTILRIDPTLDGDKPYVIPDDNPFAEGNGSGAAEIFAFGVRNPWRISFDPATNDLWVADVGQNEVEEITLLLSANQSGLGANLGWNLREGTREYSGDKPTGNVDPVYEYRHSGPQSGCSVSGGHVYRGAAVPHLTGSFVFGDYCTNRIWAISTEGGEVRFRDLGLTVPGLALIGFALDPNGELVALSLNGPVSRLIPA
ncbi:MAG: sugar dehydrogenase [Acidimicrobiaceae bacterium]|nr:sugar dehydrogenase [Acidimicrobiaceae bacterium]